MFLGISNQWQEFLMKPCRASEVSYQEKDEQIISTGVKNRKYVLPRRPQAKWMEPASTCSELVCSPGMLCDDSLSCSLIQRQVSGPSYGSRAWAGSFPFGSAPHLIPWRHRVLRAGRTHRCQFLGFIDKRLAVN